MDASAVLHKSLDDDLAEMVERGIPRYTLLDKRFDLGVKLDAMLAHYANTTERLPGLRRIEDDILVPIPSRGGKRGSNRYRFLARIDGFWVDDLGQEWIVEFKLRRELQSLDVMELVPQYRWYAWARARESKRPVAGVLLDERRNGVPGRPTLVQADRKGNFRPSHAVDQDTSADAYVAACAEYGVEPKPGTVDALRAREWQRRTFIPFRADEIEQAGMELRSAASLIGNLDSGFYFPIRNGSKWTCDRCDFKRICASPDPALVDELFVRGVPKRLRHVEVEPAPGPAEMVTLNNEEPAF